MPAPAVYILAIVGTIAAGIAFKEFVYEPHLAPKIEQWAEEFLAKRKARRSQRAGAIAVPATSGQGANEDPSWRSKRSDDGEQNDQMRQSIELENLVNKDVREWRSEVVRNQSQGLRHRNNAGPSGSQSILEEPTNSIPFVPMSPTHVLFDSSSPSTPSTLPSRGSSPSARVSSVREMASQSTLRSPLSVNASVRLPTPDPFSDPSSPNSPHATLRSPSSVPSLSQSHPLDLDYELGVELLSPPSSRPDSPFSSFSQSPSVQGSSQSNSEYHSFSLPNTTSPLARPPSRSMSDLDLISDIDEHDAGSDSSWDSIGDRIH